MKNIKITAKYKPKSGWIDEENPLMVYRVREINESNTGKKYVHFWGFDSRVPLNDEVVLMINGVVVNWD